MSDMRILGNGLEVSAVGLGCMGYTHGLHGSVSAPSALWGCGRRMEGSGGWKGSPDPEADGVAEMLLSAFDVHKA